MNNPLTALLAPLERLVTERGSSAVLREHVALLRTQLEIRDAELAKLIARNTELEAEVNNLRTVIKICEDRCKQVEKELTAIKKRPAKKIVRKTSSRSWVRDY